MQMQIKELREKAGMTQQQLASKMGVLQNSVSQWESGIVLPRARQLPDLADALGCTIDALYGRDPEIKDAS